MRNVIVEVPVQVPDEIDNSEVASHINTMLNIGHADAADTAGIDARLDGFDYSAIDVAGRALKLDIGQPTVRPVPPTYEFILIARVTPDEVISRDDAERKLSAAIEHSSALDAMCAAMDSTVTLRFWEGVSEPT